MPRRASLIFTTVLGACGHDSDVVSSQAQSLALRTQVGILLDHDLASAYQETLDLIYAFDARMRCIAASPWFDPSTFSVVTAPGEATIAWDAGILKTGILDIDKLLGLASVDSVQRLEVAQSAYYLFSVAEPVSTPVLVEQLNSIPEMTAMAPLSSEEEAQRFGSDIVMTDPDAEVVLMRYGEGDCSAGCIARHQWTLRRSGDGFVVEAEEGDEVETFGACLENL